MFIMHWLLFVYGHHLTVTNYLVTRIIEVNTLEPWLPPPPNPHLTYTWPWALQTCVYHWWELPLASFLPWQTCVCRNKTRLLTQQKYTCCDKTFVLTNIFLLQQIFVVTNIILTWQRFCLDKLIFVVTNMCLSRQTPVCQDKTFVASKMILVAGPANVALWWASREFLITPPPPHPPVNLRLGLGPAALWGLCCSTMALAGGSLMK